ncbi:MAG: DUF4190 domain-containing protein, partial [Clostridia bacterium]|nr:DUF4190 domain-containing protein [Clostridia bacterium]
MNNGDSFHNGAENLELQKRNRLGDESGTDQKAAKVSHSAFSDDKSPYGSSYSSVNLPPHKRPYISIYAQNGGVSYPQDSRKIIDHAEGRENQTAPEQRNYTNIYAQRVAERNEAYRPGEYSNTPNPAHPQSGFSSESKNGIPYYGDETASPYQDYSVDPAVIARKNKFNIASLVLGIVSLAGNLCCLTCLTPITAILAIIFGCVGRIGGRFEKKGLTGLILGIVYWAF